MTAPYKIVETRQYTEVVYYNADGVEVARETQNDDFSWDTSEPEDLTEQEIEDWL
ncbi:hypothetical protein [Subtercola vilae]|uniref:hypothetical protein n=1 Tax=Subtercola vilae TaxID=2056433 RepID=UPI001375A77E|nr:hypothetical protein [Subtercola vilae]